MPFISKKPHSLLAHFSSSETKGVECYETFAKMQDCFSRYPGVYKTADDDDENDKEDNSIRGHSVPNADQSDNEAEDVLDQVKNTPALEVSS